MSHHVPSPESIMLPSELERRQIFYWLKRISSYTAWNRILGYYQAWADITETSVREAVDKGWIVTFDAEGKVNGGLLVTRHTSEKTYPTGYDTNGKIVYETEPAHVYTEYTGTSIPESDYRLILKGLAHMDEGVRRLRQGDKRVFQYNANGEFVMGNRAASAWMQTLFRIEDHETGIDEEHTPHWGEFEKALRTLNDVKGEVWPFIIETSDPRDLARNIYWTWLIDKLRSMIFPAVLPEVPDPNNNTLIPTGEVIPHTGIWEPVIAPKPAMSLFRTVPPPTGPFPLDGCMNYLHGGSPAPKVKQANANGEGGFEQSVTWRLLWRDDRYEDGTVPAEEAGYVFQQPQASVPSPSSTIETATPSDVVFSKTGQPAPRAGRWLVETDLHANVTVAQGELLPQHNGRDVRWVLTEQ